MVEWLARKKVPPQPGAEMASYSFTDLAGSSLADFDPLVDRGHGHRPRRCQRLLVAEEGGDTLVVLGDASVRLVGIAPAAFDGTQFEFADGSVFRVGTAAFETFSGTAFGDQFDLRAGGDDRVRRATATTSSASRARSLPPIRSTAGKGARTGSTCQAVSSSLWVSAPRPSPAWSISSSKAAMSACTCPTKSSPVRRIRCSSTRAHRMRRARSVHAGDVVHGFRAQGGDGADLLSGGGGNDSLDGGDGDDVLYASDGWVDAEYPDSHDTVLGGAGNDVLHAVGSIGLLTGGAGADRFTVGYVDADGEASLDIVQSGGFSTVAAPSTITDFDAEEGDRIRSGVGDGMSGITPLAGGAWQRKGLPPPWGRASRSQESGWTPASPSSGCCGRARARCCTPTPTATAWWTEPT
ncbi:hypothetical protein HK414_14010 [Ramlibacter terrae]|uniref:Calcium-binding protein n=1 Tax=Ramlibacter terrae TaxID=2732511 RepID=A0ABX6P337_9BURK|nr:hypothetical protein HK414_14010 [Ramlibacter terrae]